MAITLKSFMPNTAADVFASKERKPASIAAPIFFLYGEPEKVDWASMAPTPKFAPVLSDESDGAQTAVFVTNEKDTRNILTLLAVKDADGSYAPRALVPLPGGAAVDVKILAVKEIPLEEGAGAALVRFSLKVSPGLVLDALAPYYPHDKARLTVGAELQVELSAIASAAARFAPSNITVTSGPFYEAAKKRYAAEHPDEDLSEWAAVVNTADTVVALPSPAREAFMEFRGRVFFAENQTWFGKTIQTAAVALALDENDENRMVPLILHINPAIAGGADFDLVAENEHIQGAAVLMIKAMEEKVEPTFLVAQETAEA